MAKCLAAVIGIMWNRSRSHCPVTRPYVQVVSDNPSQGALFRQLDGFAETHKLQFLKELDLDTLAIFRAAWKDGSRSSLKKLQRLRAFLRFTERRKWIEHNPTIEPKAPKVQNKPTMPFTRGEMIRVLVALEPYGESAGIRNAQRLRAFALLLRYWGLRIGDAVQLDFNRIQESKLLLHTEKTGVAVYCVCRTWLSKHWTQLHIPARAISSGQASQPCEAPKENGSADFSDFLS